MNPAAAAAVQGALPGGAVGDKAKAFVMIAVAVFVIVILIIAIKKGSAFFDDIFSTFGKVGEKLGIKDSAEDKAADAAISAADAKANTVDSPFNPNIYKTRTQATALLSGVKAKALAKQVYDSVGTVYDDPETGYAAFKQCKNWCQVSQLCDTFQAVYSKDCYGWLKIKYDRTSQKDILAKIVNYCFSLPRY